MSVTGWERVENPIALVVAPTKQLAQQTVEVAKQFCEPPPSIGRSSLGGISKGTEQLSPRNVQS